jgi:hypothetical protein
MLAMLKAIFSANFLTFNQQGFVIIRFFYFDRIAFSQN